MTDTDSAVEAAAPGVDLDVFARRFLAHAASQLPGRPDESLAGLARASLSFGATREPGQTLIRVVEVDDEVTAVDVVTGDAPYLVDSARAELERTGYEIERLLHPQMVVARDGTGRLVKIYDIDDNADLPDGAIVESWMPIELDHVDADRHEALFHSLAGVFADVHHAVADAPAMYTLIRQLADQLTADPGEFDRETSQEAGELLRWLADGNYMILGHAAYSANDLANPRARTQEEDADGVLRGQTRISPLEL